MDRAELLKIAKPVLFNTQMVQAILEGRKTVTRRVVKTQPDEKHNFPLGFVIDSTNKKDIGKFVFGIDEFGGSHQYAKPPFKKGDYLYVRESVFQGVAHSLDMSGETVGFLTNDFEYFADGIHQKDHWTDKHQNVFMRRRPSIHMPKEAARLFLKVTDVRVERLQDITEEQAKAEGIRSFYVGMGESGYATSSDSNSFYDSPIGAFASLWNSTIKTADLDKYGWEANPWVWVIEFERVVERLEECKKTHEKRLLSTKLKPHEKIREVRLEGCYINAIEIVKEECGISE